MHGGADERGVCEGTGLKNEATLTRGAATSLGAFKVTLLIVLERGSKKHYLILLYMHDDLFCYYTPLKITEGGLECRALHVAASRPA